MATVTMAQAAQLETNPLRKGVMLGIAQEGIAADILNFRDLGGRLKESGVRYDEVISPDWIGISGSISSKTANGKPIAFSVYQLAVHIDMPSQLDEASEDSIKRMFTQQAELAIKGSAYAVNDALINGDQASDPHQPNGLRRLSAELDSRQRIGTTEIDLTAAYSDANAEALFARWDRAIYAVDGHKPDFALANSDMLLMAESFGRQYKLKGNDFDWSSTPPHVGDARSSQTTAATKPAFMYRGIPFYDIGVKADQTTKIIGNSYAEGGSAGATRTFFVRQSPQHFEGLQFKPLQTINVGGAEDGTLEDTMVKRKRITWAIGFALWNPRSISVALGVKIPTVS